MEKYICKYCNKNYITNNSRINHYNYKHKDEYLQDKLDEAEDKKNIYVISVVKNILPDNLNMYIKKIVQ